MDHKQYEKRQRDEIVSNEPADSFHAQLEGRLKQLHTCLPGIIKSFDPETQIAEVQPAIQKITTTQGAFDLPLCVDVPVIFPQAQRFFITWPVAAGDECMLFFAERCFDRWFMEGGTQEPDDYRMHDLSDAFALVGVTSQPLVIEDFQTDGVEIRSPLRESYVKVMQDKVEVLASTEIELTAPTVTINGDVVHNGSYTQNGGTSTHDGVNVGKDHKHTGVTVGGALTGVPA